MQEIFSLISDVLSQVSWVDKNGTREPSDFACEIDERWPLAEKLREMMAKTDPKGRSVGLHVRGVAASMNELLPGSFNPIQFFIESDAPPFNTRTRRLAWDAYNRLCLIPCSGSDWTSDGI